MKKVVNGGEISLKFAQQNILRMAFLKRIFSMSFVALALFAFFIAIAAATFIENDFGTPVAQKWVYKATWFTIIIAYLAIAMLVNIFVYELYKKEKITSLIFHVSLIVIVIGAWTTRLIGFEGAMLIPEGGASNEIISSDSYIHIHVDDQEIQYTHDFPVILEGVTNNYFEEEIEFPGEEESILISFAGLIENVKDTLIPEAPKFGDPYLEIVIAGSGGREYYYLKSGEKLADTGFKIAFNNSEETDAIKVLETDSGLFFMAPFDLDYFQMADQSSGKLVRDSLHHFVPKRLYSNGNNQFVFNNYYPSAQRKTISSAEETGMKEVWLKVKQGAFEDTVKCRGGKGTPMVLTQATIGNLNYRLGYGSIVKYLPFYIYLDDFVLENYPGTSRPSSYSSYVTVVDPELGLEKKHHIYMNNVLDYGGYRFFQSDYDKNGQRYTILSVNQDAPGTMITYIGYFLLGLGFVLNLLSRKSRFRFLLNKAKETRLKREALALALLFSTSFGFSQSQAIDADHAEKFGELLVQDFQGRIKPIHTAAFEMMKKVSRSTSYEGQSPMQVYLGIHTNIQYWNAQELVYVSGKGVRKKIGVEEDQYRVPIMQFFDSEFRYKLTEDVETAQHKKPSQQSQYDKDILKTDERVNILLGIMSGAYFKIMPLPEDSTQTWYSPFDQEAPFVGEPKLLFNIIMPMYQTGVQRGIESGNWGTADSVIYLIDSYQRKTASPDILPSKAKVSLEIFYNKSNILKRAMQGYIIIALLLLVIQYIKLLKPNFKDKWFTRVGMVLLIVVVGFHGLFLGIRWYLSGHAPWSDGYEALSFIAFVVGLAGLFLGKFNKIIPGAAAFLAWLIIFVTYLADMDPEMSNLVPVLKSYWLQIHVAVITGSYAFLGLGAVLALMNLIIYLSINKNNKSRLLLAIKETTFIAEIVLTIGLFMLTIGTFLGGVWANESWGRYWGWDAKETWALASVLLYAVVLHLRFVPGLKSVFTFNTFTLWSFSSIIMTFFGVNYYLSGLHSYAQGDPVPIPLWVPISVGCLILLNVAAYFVKRNVMKKPEQRETQD